MLPMLAAHISFDWTSLWPFVILIGISVLIPVFLSICKLKFIPVFVVEIVVGIIVGIIISQSEYVRNMKIFGEFHDGVFEFNALTAGLYSIGMAILLFLSGLDTDFSVLKPQMKKDHKTLNVFGLSWILIGAVFVVSFLASLLFMPYYTNVWLGIPLMTVVFSSTFASLVIPLVHSENLHSTTIGKIICTYSTIAELLSIILISLLLIISHHGKLWLIIIFGIILALTFVLKKYTKGQVFKDKMEGIVFLGVRMIIMVLLACVIITAQTGVEFILGAFLAGMIMKATKLKHKTAEIFEAIGYGLFVPIFYLLVGISIGVAVDFTNPITLLLIVLLFVMLVVTKAPFLALLKWYPARTAIPTMFVVSSTIIVALACEHFHAIDHEFLDALIIASALTCIIPPILFDIDKKYGTSRPKYDPIIIDPHDIEKTNGEH